MNFNIDPEVLIDSKEEVPLIIRNKNPFDDTEENPFDKEDNPFDKEDKPFEEESKPFEEESKPSEEVKVFVSDEFNNEPIKIEVNTDPNNPINKLNSLVSNIEKSKTKFSLDKNSTRAMEFNSVNNQSSMNSALGGKGSRTNSVDGTQLPTDLVKRSQAPKNIRLTIELLDDPSNVSFSSNRIERFYKYIEIWNKSPKTLQGWFTSLDIIKNRRYQPVFMCRKYLLCHS